MSKPRVVITDKELAEKLQGCNDCDQEEGHAEADRLLCETLLEPGYTESVDTFRRLPKWYA